MAEGLARARYGSRVRVFSAGSVPSTVNPLAVAVLSEIGIDISSHESKGFETVDPASIDVVVTLCANEVCPMFLGSARQLHWPLEDPGKLGATTTERLQQFRSVRDEIARRIRTLDVEVGL
tara:strand:- start:342 stop:704 length:363 start_codon:yes stop_codon:yes gene_type:complete